MFDPTYTPTAADNSAFKPLVQTLIDESRAFDGPVYLVNGDSHVYNSDLPLAAGSPWLDFYGVTGSADNLNAITVDGSTTTRTGSRSPSTAPAPSTSSRGSGSPTRPDLYRARGQPRRAGSGARGVPWSRR